MIDKLEVGKKYRLVDKEDYFGRYCSNEVLFEKYAVDGCYTLEEEENSCGLIDGYCVIDKSEYKCFEEVVDVTKEVVETTKSTEACNKDLRELYEKVSGIPCSMALYITVAECTAARDMKNQVLSTIEDLLLQQK